ncbi:MAG: putative phosphoribosyl transferase [Myxococcaceae bacterium]|jgi:predicted phosphoribosyltransferase|nr:putative phosphoribosyl transferase [Myxococcaceae bacterium]
MTADPRQLATSSWRFIDRRDGGRRLADALSGYAGTPGLVVLALPRGGVPVGYEVALALGAALDVFVVRKLGFPNHPELAMGAIASGGACVLNEDLIRRSGISDAVVSRVAARELREIARREHEYRDGRPPLPLGGKTVILVDDGLATGATMRSAVEAVREQAPARLVVAIPIAAPESCREMRTVADDVVCAMTPEPLRAVGLWYENFEQITDAEVRALLVASRTT